MTTLAAGGKHGAVDRPSSAVDCVLWVGGVFTEQAMMRNNAVSPAANRWQAGLLAALRRMGVRLVLLSVAPQRAWPYGSLFPGAAGDCAPDFETAIVPYCNVVGIREVSAAFSLRQKVKAYCRSDLSPRALITYNPTKENVWTGKYASAELGLPWVDLCADAYDPGPKWDRYPAGAEGADAHIFLSAHAAAAAPFRTVLHLDGGVDGMLKSAAAASSKKILFYSGMLSRWGGIDLLLAAFAKVRTPDVELWVCGHGESQALLTATKADSRIRFYGLVSEEELHQLSLQATAFVNPRPSSVGGNNMNFPSKVLQYLRYGNPVISTWTPGLSDEYRSVLYVVGAETAESMARSIDNVLGSAASELSDYTRRVESFLLQSHSWDVQAGRLMHWLRSEVNPVR